MKQSCPGKGHLTVPLPPPLQDRAGPSSRRAGRLCKPFLHGACPASPLQPPRLLQPRGAGCLSQVCPGYVTAAMPASFPPPPARVFTFWLRGEFHSEEIAIVSQPSHGKVAVGGARRPSRGGAAGAREAGERLTLSRLSGSPSALSLYKGHKEFFFA